ncbi:hypothetical protein V5P93_004764 [Actinokineospora auranticolor]|uniref:Uncharacterized protein n=1 Tax=Actinokineospora auranticolor TaxID=155976 RepID=A0A2S6GND9_9PSEU|nr:hypothetical protein [Actinokineospora auranticolor]PPK66727.1 hypothetical protein CLV40_109112 [Actinokineospora auranticolor]
MVEASWVSVALAVAAGVSVLGTRLGQLDCAADGYRRVTTWAELAAALLLVLFSDDLVRFVGADPGWVWAVVVGAAVLGFCGADDLVRFVGADPGWVWAVVVGAAVLGFCGAGLLVGLLTATLIQTPDAVWLAAVVVPGVLACALHNQFTLTRTAVLLIGASGRDERLMGTWWRLVASVAPVLPLVAVFAVPLPGASAAEWVSRVVVAVILGAQLYAADRARYRLLRVYRRRLRATESTLAVALALLAASPVGASVVTDWVDTSALTGPLGYGLLAAVFVVHLAVLRAYSTRVPGNALVVAVILLRAVVTALVALSLAAVVFHPEPDLLPLSVLLPVPAAFVQVLGARRLLVERQVFDAALLMALPEDSREHAVERWLDDAVDRPVPDFSLPDAVGALAHRAVDAHYVPLPFPRVEPDQCLQLATVLVSTAFERVVSKSPPETAVSRSRAQSAAVGDLAMWQAKVFGELDHGDAARAAARQAVDTFDAIGATLATALAMAAVVDTAVELSAAAGPRLVEHPDSPDGPYGYEPARMLAEHDDLPPAAKRVLAVAAARLAFHRGDETASAALLRSVQPARAEDFRVAMRADGIAFGADASDLLGATLATERQLAHVVQVAAHRGSGPGTD